MADNQTNRKRTRNTVKNTKAVYHYTAIRNSDGAVLSNSTQDPFPYFAGTTGKSEEINDRVNHGFKRIIAQGGVILSDLSRTINEREMTEGSMSCVFPSWYSEGSTHSFTLNGDIASALPAAAPACPLPNFEAMVASMSNAVLIKAYAKMTQSEIMLGEILSDLDKSVSMLRRPFGDAQTLCEKIYDRRAWLVRKNYKGNLKFSKRTAYNLAKATANAWLEYRYGWRPIVSDAITVVKAVQRKLTTHSDRFKFHVARAGDALRNSNTRSFVGAPSAIGSQWSYDGVITNENVLRCGAGVLYELKTHNADDWNRIMGSRTSDIAPTLWEIVPWSFVVDWFVNIGDWIQAIQPTPGLNVLGSWTTSVRENTVKCSGTIKRTISSPQLWVGSGSAGSATSKSTSITRSCNLPLTPPSLTSHSMNVNRTLDALSLSLQPVNRLLQKLRH